MTGTDLLVTAAILAMGALASAVTWRRERLARARKARLGKRMLAARRRGTHRTYRVVTMEARTLDPLGDPATYVMRHPCTVHDTGRPPERVRPYRMETLPVEVGDA